jgi:glycosyltransferase involved in cell wall biosynthesis
MPLVSAAIITHNRARYLGDAIRSVLDQSFRDLELIVVDDGSTDETPEVVAPYLDRIRYVRQEHSGKAAARNAAVALSRGAFFAFCDSDDVWNPDRLERQMDAFRRNPHVGMVHGHVEIIDENGRPMPERTASARKLFASAHRHGATYASYALDCRCFSSTILLRRNVFEVVGPYDPDLAIEDYDFYLRVLLHFDVLFLGDEPLAKYRAHDAKTGDLELGSGQIQTAEKHLAYLDDHPDLVGALQARRNFHLMIARTWRALGDRRRARAAALRALRLGSAQALRFAR